MEGEWKGICMETSFKACRVRKMVGGGGWDGQSSYFSYHLHKRRELQQRQFVCCEEVSTETKGAIRVWWRWTGR